MAQRQRARKVHSIHQPPLQGERRIPLASCMHPTLAAMVEMDAHGDHVSVGWIINDAIARYYQMDELASTAIYASRRQAEMSKRKRNRAGRGA